MNLRLFFESVEPEVLKELLESLSEEALINLINAAMEVELKSLRVERFQRCFNQQGNEDGE